MAKVERPCEAPEHADGCNGRGDTKDHFTPKCIAKLLGWKNNRINAPENIQYLSRACHEQKDRSTPRRLKQVREQINGRMIKLGEHET